MNVVDSSAWLEYFSEGPNAAYFSKAIENTDQLLVPVLTLFEVFKRVFVQRGEAPGLQALAMMHEGRVIDLDASLAVVAARISAEHRLPMADSVILATARAYDAVLWTQDADFDGFEKVKFKPHAKR